MIMDLPERFFIGNAEQKNDAFVEDGVLKIRKEASYRYVIFELTFKLKGGKHICGYCGCHGFTLGLCGHCSRGSGA